MGAATPTAASAFLGASPGGGPSGAAVLRQQFRRPAFALAPAAKWRFLSPVAASAAPGARHVVMMIVAGDDWLGGDLSVVCTLGAPGGAAAAGTSTASGVGTPRSTHSSHSAG